MRVSIRYQILMSMFDDRDECFGYQFHVALDMSKLIHILAFITSSGSYLHNFSEKHMNVKCALHHL